MDGLVLQLLRCRRGSVASIMAVSMVAVVAMGAVAVEASGWYATKRDLQRIADAAAIQGAFIYRDTNSDTEKALKAAAGVAASAGAAAGTETYDSASRTLTSGEITAKVVDITVGTGTEAWIQVSLSRSTQNLLGAMFNSHTVVGATGAANIADSGSQACILGLASTGKSVNVNGGATVTVSGCSIKSNGDFDTGGASAVIGAAGLYADGVMTGQGTLNSSDIKTGNQVQETADPYADNGYFDDCGDAAKFTSAATLDVGSGGTLSLNANQGTMYLKTGGGNSIQGTLNLGPGTYVVKGDVKLTTSGSMYGDGVSLIVCGSIDSAATSVIDLSAPTQSDGYGFTGVAIAANGTAKSTINGGNNTSIDGLIYVPNGNLIFAGHSDATGSGCLQLVANVVTISGTSDIAGSCTGFELELPASGVSRVALAQ